MPPDTTVVLALAAALIEAAFGYPPALYRAIGHPVTWMGALVGWLDRALNRETMDFSARRAAGVLALALLLGVTGLVAFAIQWALAVGAAGLIALAVVAASLPAQRSLDEHVRAVADALGQGLQEGRRAVSMIVGRNTAVLDEAGVSRAAIESLAENFADGVVAPVFWTAVLGLPGGALYKAANTADSMIGHRSPRHLAFGWAAARIDDLINLPASRLAAVWIVLAATVTPDASPRDALRAVFRDARRHRSPNAGWPEAAMAGALGLSLAGPRIYGDARVEDAFMGDGRRDANAADIARALRLYRAACVFQLGALAAVALALAAL
ncbi:adenosylcobinamide-phosphate synthase CbiB [Alsobacter sp. SYSU M60028]|uniref:Cobalamin biosynthesis protein CobD n=1 Tax=Alsobacter ponti TaxID=2962936 RepID=A0ABT1LIT7_9HYPH|nr:adenosylcobinamide-phosphate synthase CbiB [Alsobacter ponti]MCP8940866.1 adenosylcobinamide-phosphate synthase CbiB [Alsobacter ponti]